MKLNYSLTSEDFLTFQLYSSSRSDLQKKRRNRSRNLVPLIYIAFGLFLFYQKRNLLALIIILIFAVVWWIFHPYYSSWSYKRHFSKNIEENFNARINIPTTLEIKEKTILTQDEGLKSVTNKEEIDHLIELPEHFYIQLVSKVSLVVPKKNIDDIPLFKEKLFALGANYINELEWKWK